MNMAEDLDDIPEASAGTTSNKNRGADVEDAGENSTAGGTAASTSIGNAIVNNCDVDNANVDGSNSRKTDKSKDHGNVQLI